MDAIFADIYLWACLRTDKLLPAYAGVDVAFIVEGPAVSAVLRYKWLLTRLKHVLLTDGLERLYTDESRLKNCKDNLIAVGYTVIRLPQD